MVGEGQATVGASRDVLAVRSDEAARDEGGNEGGVSKVCELSEKDITLESGTDVASVMYVCGVDVVRTMVAPDSSMWCERDADVDRNRHTMAAVGGGRGPAEEAHISGRGGVGGGVS